MRMNCPSCDDRLNCAMCGEPVEVDHPTRQEFIDSLDMEAAIESLSGWLTIGQIDGAADMVECIGSLFAAALGEESS